MSTSKIDKAMNYLKLKDIAETSDHSLFLSNALGCVKCMGVDAFKISIESHTGKWRVSGIFDGYFEGNEFKLEEALADFILQYQQKEYDRDKEKIQKDAERYRFLKKMVAEQIVCPPNVRDYFYINTADRFKPNNWSCRGSLDNIIDETMKNV